MTGFLRTLTLSLALVSLALPLPAQQGTGQAPDPNAPPPIDGKMTKEQKQKAKKTLKELDTPYKTWLNEDVVYIISPEERNAFLKLSTNEEREQFIEQFWLQAQHESGFARQRLQGRALPPDCLRQ